MGFDPNALRTVMQTHGIKTQTDLAQRMEVSQACVSRVLGGVSIPSAHFLTALRRAISDVAVDYYFKGGGG